MATLLIYPGQTSEPAALNAILAEERAADIVAVEKEIAARKSAGIPIDDETKWGEVKANLEKLTAAVAAEKTDDVEAFARKIVGGVDGNMLKVPEAFVGDKELDGIKVTFTMVPDARRRDWTARLAVKYRARFTAMANMDEVGYQRALDEIDDVSAEQIVGCISAIEGVEGMKGSVAESIDGIRLSPLFGPLVRAARYFLRLPAGKALRCGHLPPST